MNNNYLLATIFALLGTLSLLASVLGWQWFFETESGRSFVKWLGLRGARIFYAILGLLILFMSYTLFREA